MKRISKVLVFLLMTVTFPLLCMPAEAALSGDYYSDSDAKEFYDSISFREIEPTENMGKIVSFDVANQILLAFSSQKIAVCDTSGKILKAFEFQTYGNYYVQWCGDDIQIYFVRGDSLLTVTQDGELVSCIAVNPDRATNETSIQKLEHKTTCEISGVTYKIQKGRPMLELLSGYKYTQMVKIDNTGRETILYDCTAQYSSETPTIIVLIIMCFFDNVYDCHLLAKEWAKIAINLCIEGKLKINRLSISMFAIFIVVALTSCAQVGRTLFRM